MRNLLLALIAASPALCGNAQSISDINSPGPEGYLQRGRMMWADHNFEGCMDQMSRVLTLNPTEAQTCDARWYMALSAMGLDDDAALEMMTAWIADYPGSPRRQEALMTVGDILFNSGEYQRAIDAYAKVDSKALTPLMAATLTYRCAYSEMMLGRLDKADTLFSSLLSDSRFSNAARFYLGYIAYSRGDYARALSLFEECDRSSAPGNATPYYMAQIYYVQGDNNAALRYAREAIAANLIPEFTTESKRIAGEALYALGDREAAVGYLWDYAATAPSPAPSAYYILGLSEWDRGDWAAAGKLFQQAARQDDAMGQSAWLFLGQTYLKEGNTNSALMAFENAFRMNHDKGVSETAFYNYAVAKSNGGRAPFETSAAVFEEFLEKYPDSRYRSAVEKYVISGYLNDNQYDQALQIISRIPNPDSETLAAKKRALFALGTSRMGAGDAEGARKLFSQSRAIDAGDSSITRQAILWEANAASQLGDTEAAREGYRRFLSLAPESDPNRAVAEYSLGYTLYGNRAYKDANDAFTRAVNLPGLEPRLSADARSRMADILYYDKKYPAAAAQYRQAAELSPSTADYPLYQAAVMRGLGGDRGGEVQELDIMMGRFPASAYVPDAMLEKASALATLGRQSDADAVYSSLLAKYPETAQGRKAALIMAIDRRTAGDTRGAVAAYKRVITSYPSSEEARVAADDLKSIMADAGTLDSYVEFMNSVPGAPEVQLRDIDAAAFRAAEKRYLEQDNPEALLAYVGKYPGGVYEAEALYYLAENAEGKGDVDESVRFARRLLAAHPTSSVAEDAMVILAKGQLRQGDPAAALDTYRRLEKSASNPTNLLAARMGIMTTSLRSDDNASVISTADKVLASSDLPTAALNETRFMRALALSRIGRTSEAESQWAEVAKNPADINGAKSAVYLAQSILDRGDAKGAQRSIDRFIDANPQYPYWLARGFVILSDALRSQGKTFEADQYLKTLRANYPGQEPDIFTMIDERLAASSGSQPDDSAKARPSKPSKSSL